VRGRYKRKKVEVGRAVAYLCHIRVAAAKSGRRGAAGGEGLLPPAAKLVHGNARFWLPLRLRLGFRLRLCSLGRCEFRRGDGIRCVRQGR
jgi:hypothetical protein